MFLYKRSRLGILPDAKANRIAINMSALCLAMVFAFSLSQQAQAQTTTDNTNNIATTLQIRCDG